jgi:hypothetical protein
MSETEKHGKRTFQIILCESRCPLVFRLSDTERTEVHRENRDR